MKHRLAWMDGLGQYLAPRLPVIAASIADRQDNKSDAELKLCTCGHRRWLHDIGKKQICSLAGCHSCKGFEQGRDE